MEILFEIIKYGTQGFWIFLGVWGLMALTLFGGTHVVVSVLRTLFNFIQTLVRGYKPVSNKTECKCDKDKCDKK